MFESVVWNRLGLRTVVLEGQDKTLNTNARHESLGAR